MSRSPLNMVPICTEQLNVVPVCIIIIPVCIERCPSLHYTSSQSVLNVVPVCIIHHPSLYWTLSQSALYIIPVYWTLSQSTLYISPVCIERCPSLHTALVRNGIVLVCMQFVRERCPRLHWALFCAEFVPVCIQFVPVSSERCPSLHSVCPSQQWTLSQSASFFSLNHPAHPQVTAHTHTYSQGVMVVADSWRVSAKPGGLKKQTIGLCQQRWFRISETPPPQVTGCRQWAAVGAVFIWYIRF